MLCAYVGVFVCMEKRLSFSVQRHFFVCVIDAACRGLGGFHNEFWEIRVSCGSQSVFLV